MSETFDKIGIVAPLLAGIHKAGIQVPTRIQTKVVPLALLGKDIIGQSATGTGKTLAYLLPLFQKIDTTKREMQVMILAPTHELAIQIVRQIEVLANNSGIPVTSTPIIGNVNIARQIEKLKEKPHIIVGSSGRILELIQKRKIRAVNRQYQNGDLKNSFLAFAATDDPQVNCEVAKEARKIGIPVNVADDALSSDFIVPSSIHRGVVTVAVSTSGKSPALARKIRARLEAEFGEEYDLLASLVEETRRELKERQIKVSNDDWQKALDFDLLVALLKKGEKGKAAEALRKNLGIY